MSFAEIDELAAILRRLFEERGPMATISDIGHLEIANTTAEYRRRIAEEVDALSADGAFLAEAVVIRNPLYRAVYLGYLFRRRATNHPSRAFATDAEAERWIAEQLAARVAEW